MSYDPLGLRVPPRLFRAWQRAAGLAALAAVFWLSLAAGPSLPPVASAASAAPTFTVNYPLDVPADLVLDTDYSVCRTNTSNTVCSLRAAIMKAN